MDGAESPREWDRDRDRDEDEYDASERRRHRSSKPRKRSSSSFADDVPPPSLPLPPPPPPPPPPDEWPRRRSSSSSGRRKSDAADVEDDDAVAAAEEEERTAEERSRRTASTATFSSDFRRAPPTRASKMDDAIRNDSKSRRWDDVEPLRLMDGPADLERFGRKDASARERDFDARDFDPSFEDLASRGRSRVSEVLQDESKAPRGGGGGGGGRRMEDSERRIKGKGRAEVAEDDLYMKGKSEEKKYRVRELFDGMPEDINSSVGQRQGFKDDRHRGGGRDYGYGAGWDEAQSSDVQAHEDGVDRERERGRMKDRRDVAWDEDDVGRGGRGRSGRGMRSRSSRKRSWSPLDKKRSRRDSEEFDRDYSDDRAESDTERSIGMKGRDREREGAYCRDDRMERARDWEGSKEHWKNRHHDSRHEKDLKDEDRDYEFDRDWEIHGRERDRTERDKMQRGGLERKDKGRLDNMKNIAGFGPPGEYGRSESASGFLSNRRNDSGGSMDFDGNWGFPSEDRGRINDAYLAEPHDRYEDDPSQGLEHGFGINSGRALDGADCNMHGGRARMHKVPINNRGGRGGGPIGSGGQSPTFRNSNQGSGSFTRGMQQQGGKGGRGGRGGRGRVTARDSQRGGIPPLPMMGPGPGPGPAPGVPGIGPPFGHLGLPPAALQSMGPGMGPSPGPPMGHAGMFPHYPAPLVWGPGRGGGEMNMLPLPHGLSPVPPPGPSGPRFPPNMGPAPNQGVYFNQPGPSRVTSPGIAGTGYGPANPIGRPIVNDKPSSGRVVPRMTGPPGKAPSRGEQNDYSQNFVDTGMRPQNFIRELELANVVEDYPKLRELIQKKDEIVAKTASPPMYLKCDLKETSLSSELFGTKFDVILVDPPWEEYVQRAPGVGDHMEYWTPQEIQNLKIEAIAENPSFIFLWVGSGDGLEHGRACLKKWGFRRCEDICWVKTNKSNPSPGLRHDSFTIFQRSKEHCLMGIKGTVRRSTDGHIIHANIDTDIIIAEEPPHGSTTKPEDLYRIVEHFALGRRRLELFGEDHNIRAGWLTVGKGLTSSNFNAESYAKNFVDKDGKLWQGGAGRNPPPDAPHLVGTTPEIESLRPKSPPPKSQQQQQQATSVSQPAANSTNKKSSATSPSHPQKSQASSAATLVTVAGITQEIQATSAPGTTLSVPEISRNMTFTSIEQKSVTIQSSISKVPNIGSSRVGSDGENAVEDLFLDTGTGGGTM